MSGVYLKESSLRHSRDSLKAARTLAIEYGLGVLSAEGANHLFKLLAVHRPVKRNRAGFRGYFDLHGLNRAATGYRFEKEIDEFLGETSVE
jgi:hypothetical protein